MTELATTRDILETIVITSGLTTLWGITNYFALTTLNYKNEAILFGKSFGINGLLFWTSLFSSNVVTFVGVYRLSKYKM